MPSQPVSPRAARCAAWTASSSVASDWVPMMLNDTDAPTPMRDPPLVPVGKAATVEVLSLSLASVMEPSPASAVAAFATGAIVTLALPVTVARLSEPIRSTPSAPATPMPAPPAPDEAEAPNVSTHGVLPAVRLSVEPGTPSVMAPRLVCRADTLSAPTLYESAMVPTAWVGVAEE